MSYTVLADKLKKNAYSLGWIFLLMAIFLRIISDIVKGYDRESWQITEWLINYQAGFVRRGLPGEIIYRLSALLDCSPYAIIIILSLLIYIVTVSIMVRLFKRSGFRLLPLLSPLLLGMPVFSHFWVRKDVFLILIFIGCLYLLRSGFRGRLFILNLLICIAILSHESFTFWGLGGIYILLVGQDKSLRLHTFLVPALKLMPAWICMIFCFLYNGNATTVAAINESWADKFFPYSNDQLDGATAIDALAWTLSEGLRYSFSTFTTFSDGFIYAPIIWALTLFVFVMLMCTFVLIPQSTGNFLHGNTSADKSLIRCFAIQGILVIPLFILGLDYGRWMFLWGMSAVCIRLLIPGEQALPAVQKIPALSKFTRQAGERFIKSRLYNYINHIAHHPYMNIGIPALAIPHCAWSVHHYVLTMPLFQPVMAIKRILVDKLMLCF